MSAVKKVGASILTVSMALLVQDASAEMKLGDFTLTGNISAFSDYVSRGLTNTDHKPALQGEVKLAHDPSGLYGSAWASNVDLKLPADNPDVELDFSLGWNKELQGIDVDVGMIHYNYPDSNKADGLNYEEYYLGLGYTIADVALSVKYSYAPDFGGSAPNSASYAEFGAEYELPYEITLSGHYGHSFGKYFRNEALDTNATPIRSYDDYQVGLAREFSGVTLQVLMNWTDKRGRTWSGDGARDQLVVGISKDF